MSPNNPFLHPLLLLRSDIVTCACSHSATLSFSPGQHRVSVVCPAHGRCEQIATMAPFFWSKYLTCFGSCSEGIVPTSLPSSSPASGCLLVNQYLFEHVPSRMNSEGPDHGLSSAKDNMAEPSPLLLWTCGVFRAFKGLTFQTAHMKVRRLNRPQALDPQVLFDLCPLPKWGSQQQHL